MVKYMMEGRRFVEEWKTGGKRDQYYLKKYGDSDEETPGKITFEHNNRIMPIPKSKELDVRVKNRTYNKDIDEKDKPKNEEETVETDKKGVVGRGIELNVTDINNNNKDIDEKDKPKNEEETVETDKKGVVGRGIELNVTDININNKDITVYLTDERKGKYTIEDAVDIVEDLIKD